MIRVYIAMPYGDDNSEEIRLANTRRAMDRWTALADSGFAPYCPHLSHFLHERHPRGRMHWLAQTAAWVTACDCVIAFGDSEGVRQETGLALANKMPVFRRMEDLAEAYGLEIA